MVLAFINNKGGVGKTTSAVNIAAGVANLGKKVLLIDLDSQRNAGINLGFRLPPDKFEPSITDVLLGEEKIENVVKRNLRPNLDLVPNDMRFSSFDVKLGELKDPRRTWKLKEALDPIKNLYDLIVLDCGPSFNLSTTNALLASDFFVVPMEADFLGMEGINNLLNAVKLIKSNFGKVAEILGILITKCDVRNNFDKEVIEILEAQFPNKVFETKIPINVRIKEASSHGKTLYEYDSSCAGAFFYKKAVEEFLIKLNLISPNQKLNKNVAYKSFDNRKGVVA